MSFFIARFLKSNLSSVIKNERQNFPVCWDAVFLCLCTMSKIVISILTLQILFLFVIINRSISESLWAAFIARELQTQILSTQGTFINFSVKFHIFSHRIVSLSHGEGFTQRYFSSLFMSFSVKFCIKIWLFTPLIVVYLYT